MTTNCRLRLIVVAIAATQVLANPALALPKDVAFKVVDGLDRPIADVSVKIEVLLESSDGHVEPKVLSTGKTNDEGIFKGQYDRDAVHKDETVLVDVKKDGYAAYSSDNIRKTYVLKREFSQKDINRISALHGDEQVQGLRELLAGSFESDDGDLDESVFVHERALRPALLSLIDDPKVNGRAFHLLAFIGEPEDIRRVLEHAPGPRMKFDANRWAYGVATALTEPTTDDEWEFLRRCASGDYDDLWVDAGAIQTLRLIAEPRSLQILKEAASKNKYQQDEIGRAVKYIESHPQPLQNQDVVKLGEQVADAVKMGKWQGNKEPLFNDARDKALIDCIFISGRDKLTYTATLHFADGVWKLRGIRETMQALLAISP